MHQPQRRVNRCRAQPSTTTRSSPPSDRATTVIAAVTERFRRQLHVHCYRMLGSFDEAEEVVQETFLRAWRARRTFEGRALLRSWLYRIATNACLDVIARRRPQRVIVGDEIAWLQPYPGRTARADRTQRG